MFTQDKIIKRYRKKSGYRISIIFLMAGIAALVLFFLLFVLEKYLFEGYEMLGLGLFSDLIRANLPTYYAIYDNFGNLWSWSMGIGTSMFSHADAIFDPFTYICFLFGRAHIPQMIVWSFIIKLIAAGIVFAVFLEYFRLHPIAVLVGSVLYVFCGYNMVMGVNLALGTVAVYLPVILLGLEKLISEDKKLTLLAGLFLMAVYFYYYFYMTALIAVLYFLIRVGSIGNFRWKQFWRKAAWFAVLGVLSAVLAAFVLLPQLQLVLSNMRTGSGSDTAFDISLFQPDLSVLETLFLRLFGNNFMGSPYGSGYVGAFDYFSLTPCISATFLIFFGQYLYFRRDKLRLCLTLSVFLILAVSLPVFSYIMNGFSTINYRWLFVLSALQALVFALGLNEVIKNKQFSLKALGWSAIITVLVPLLLLIGISACRSTRIFSSAEQVTEYIILLCSVAAMFGVYGLLHLYHNAKNGRQVFGAGLKVSAGVGGRIARAIVKIDKKILLRSAVMILAAVVFLSELMGSYYLWFSASGSVLQYGSSESPYSCYEDSSAELIRRIQSQDGSFYRINKDFDSVRDYSDIPSCNDAMAQGYFGLKNYNSANNSNYMNFLIEMGIYCTIETKVPDYIAAGVQPEDITGADLNYICGVYDRYELMSYLGVKYFISDKDGTTLPDNWVKKEEYEGLTLYENLAYMPLAFANTAVVSYEDFALLEDEEKDLVLQNATVVEEDLLEKYGIEQADISQYTDKQTVDRAQSKQAAFRLLNFSSDRVSFEIEVAEGAHFLSLTVPYDSGWVLYIDGERVQTEKINIALLGAYISEGTHLVELRYVSQTFEVGLLVAGVGLLGMAACYAVTMRRKMKEI